MRRLLCKDCIKGKESGTRQILPRTNLGEPAEFERVVRGVARTPKSNQRYIEINGEKHILPDDHYDCDNCGSEIKPGEPCGAWSVWTEEQGGIVEWEAAYVEASA